MSGIVMPEGAPIASKAAPSGLTGAAWPDLPGKEHGPVFERLLSPASTCVPGSPLLGSPRFARAFSEESYPGIGFSLLEEPALSLDSLEERLAEVKALYEEKLGEDVDSEDEEQVERDEDGTPWVVSVGADVRRRLDFNETRVDELSASLAEVKQLFVQKFGREVDADFEEDQEARVDALAASLTEVKQLYLEKLGEDVDADSEEDLEMRDEDGVLYVVTIGVDNRRRLDAHETRLDALVASLTEVKQLYSEKFGEDVDADFEVDHEARVDELMNNLAEIKQLYEQKFGEDVDADSEDDQEVRDEDGTPYVLTVGTHGTHLDVLAASLAEVKQLYLEKFGKDVDVDSEDDHEIRVDALAASLAEVKQLYLANFGEDVDSDSEEDQEARVDALAASLAEVKQLYLEKFGEDLDADSEDGREMRDEDGTLYVFNVGIHETCLHALTASLLEVKQLYVEKFGEDVDADFEDDREIRDKDGALYVLTSSVPETRLDGLIASLSEVKQLYLEKFSEDLDADSEEDQEVCINLLMDSLADVKQLYLEKFGEDVDADSEDDCEMRDEDGALYVLTTSIPETRLDKLTASLAEVKQMYLEKFCEEVDVDSEEDHEARADALAASLAEVKQLYFEKFGEDVDADSEEDREMRDEDGALYVSTGCGDVRETRIDALTASLAEVKQLYQDTFGEDVDADSEDQEVHTDVLLASLAEVKQLYERKFGESVDAVSEDDQEMRDEDGALYVLIAGVHDTRLDVLTASLAEVKQLYSEKFGEDADVDSEEDQEVRIDLLMASLADVKQLYSEKFGEDADAGSEEDWERRDEDGALYVFTGGADVRQREARFDALTASLAEVKQLYQQKFGEDVDTEDQEVRMDVLVASLAEVKQLYEQKFGEVVDADSEEDQEMRDDDGALYVWTIGADVRETGIDVLTASLAEVKQLYLEKFGEDVDADSEEDREVRADALAAGLAEVKQLYLEKFREDVDADSEEDWEMKDEDGALYVLTIGAEVREARIDALMASLAEVKQLYDQKFGEDVDADCGEDREVRLDTLTASLAEVKQLYEQKFGEDVDADSEGDWEMHEDDGALYILTVGAGVQQRETRIDALMASLAEVKQLYQQKFGEDVDADSEDQEAL